MKETTLVIGATSGIGLEVAKKLSQGGHHVILSGRRSDLGMSASEALNQAGASTEFIEIDAASEENIKKTAHYIESKFGTLTYLVYAAGSTIGRIPITKVTSDQYLTVMDTNLKGAYLCMKYFIPLMEKASTPAIVTISSISGHKGKAECALYSASKHALIGLSKSVSKEFPAIRINVVSPGLVDTEFVYEQNTHSLIESIMKDHTIPRLGKVNEIADTVCFLLSDKASYITGQVLIVDGGYLS